MKQSSQSSKSSSSSNSNSKSKRNSKDRDKRKSQGGSEANNHNSTDKGSPSKDSGSRLYVGIDAESIGIYAEQNTSEHISEEVCNVITEDLNYRLRYIINDALLKSRLSGENMITSDALHQTFNDLKMNPIYGCPENPSWVKFGSQNLYCLEDKEVDLLEFVDEVSSYYQPGDPMLFTKWVPDRGEGSKPLKNYYTTICQMVVSEDEDLRSKALKDIGENPNVGPITDWFYKFSYILLSKDITYDCLTMRALSLIYILECSVLSRTTVSQKLLKLLVRLILQRLLKFQTPIELLKPLCEVLAILCWRPALREFVISKILQKMVDIYPSHALPIMCVVDNLGIDAVEEIFIPHLDRFLKLVSPTEENNLHIKNLIDPLDTALKYSILEAYSIMCRGNLVTPEMYTKFVDIFKEVLVFYERYEHPNPLGIGRQEMNFARVKSRLMLERRRLPYNVQKSESLKKKPINEVFELPSEKSKLGEKLRSVERIEVQKETEIIFGKTSLILPVFRTKNRHFARNNSYCDSTFAGYNF